MSVLLVLDTATEQMHLGLRVAGVDHLRVHEGGAQASRDLLPALQALLDQSGVALAQVDAIGVGRGPGAFTGLRTACSVAQGLALGLGRPVLLLDSLHAVAEAGRRAAPAEVDWWAAIDARMGEIYAARYRFDTPAGRLLEGPALWTPEALAARLAAEPAVLAGNAAARYADRLVPVARACHPQAQPDGRALLALATTAWASGQAVDPAQALPLYVRDKVALTTAERDMRKAAA